MADAININPRHGQAGRHPTREFSIGYLAIRCPAMRCPGTTIPECLAGCSRHCRRWRLKTSGYRRWPTQ